MNKIHDVDYLYATARLRALEREMITQRDLEKMLDAASFDECYKTANDISLHSPLPSNQYEQAIGAMLQRAYALLGELTGGSELFNIFRYKYDGHNLKVIIKAQRLGSDPLSVMSPLGTMPREELIAAFNERKLEQLPLAIAEAAFEASEALAKTGDPQIVDVLLDRAVLKTMLDQALETQFPFLIHVVQSTIDVENLRTFVRLKRMGRDIGMLKKLTIEGGKLALDRLYGAFGPEGFEALREALFITDYSVHFSPLLDGLEDPKKALTAFERGAENYVMRLLRTSRLIAFGLEPLIGFLLAKENEAKLIRIVLASRQAGVSSDKISERLRETYA